MNGASLSDHFDSDVREVASVICREFRDRFKEDPDVRIEAFRDTLEGWVGQFENEASQSARTALIAELICAEMELMIETGRKIDLAQYQQRFSEFPEAINLAVSRIRRLGISDLFVAGSDTSPANPITRRTQWSVDDATTGLSDFNLELDFEVQPDQATDDSVPLKFGNYEQIEPINSGGFGTVCRAIDLRDQRVVALKFPRRDKLRNKPGLKAFIDEANKAMILNHAGIVHTFAIEAHDGYLAIVQQFIDGADLKSPSVQPTSQTGIVELIANLADALAYAHRQGIYHRDLKPGNILVDREGRPYLADFGLALHECEQHYTPSERCGTTYYMPPELVAGLTRRLDGRSDIWSLGVVFYELLTHRKPFDGVTERDIFDQIENKDPRPPRQIDASIDRELQRICLKCLERHQRDRYPTADELAEDLRHWLADSQANEAALKASTNPVPEPHLSTCNPASVSSHSEKAGQAGADAGANSPQTFTPKGIRAYGTEDAAFFIELLPGPRNRDGLPDSIRFWLSLLCEPVKNIERVPVGILFGPSGCGKTSFLKAGLLPRLPLGIATFYVEASQFKTESQLLNALRQRWPGIPDEIALADIFRGLSQGKWLPTGINKVLIVVDQFEQHLSAETDLDSSQLVKALRHCDGKQLQSLLLVRDDFLTRLSRFLDALEIDFREGENAQAIDLFDQKHAQRVLARLGRAYGQLPPEPTELTQAQQRFLHEAVKQLVQAEHVICVHLTLFAEMFRHRPWTYEELRKVGGVAGTGEKYLELTFGPNARDKRLFLQREAVERLLECLLPTESSDLRGAIKSESELMQAAGLEPQPFADLIKALEGQLRLITRSDPDMVRSVLPTDSGQPTQPLAHFQLTHDYLVPSIRAWLEQGWEMTRVGRAKTRLRNLARSVVPGQTPQKLPTSLEWLSWQFLLSQKSLKDAERIVMRAAGGRLVKQLSTLLVLCVVMGFLLVQGFRSRQRQQQLAETNDLITQLVQGEVNKVPEIVIQLATLSPIATPILQTRLRESEPNSRDRIRLAMALLPEDVHQLPLLMESLTATDAAPEHVQAVLELARHYQLQDRIDLRNRYEDVAIAPQTRFRALAAEIALRQGAGDWSKYEGLVVSGLQLQPLSSIDAWVDLLKPAGAQFVNKLKQTLATATEATPAGVLAKALHGFLSEPDRQAHFLGGIQAANGAQFTGLLNALEEGGTAKQMIPVLTAAVEPTLADSSQANLCMALFRLGVDQPLLAMYQGGLEDPRSLLAVFASKPERINAYQLMSLYQRSELEKFSELGLRRSVLQSLAHHAAELFDADLQHRLSSIARHHAESDPDACCFSTAELILKRLGVGSRKEWRELRRASTTDGVLGNVLIDRLGNAFSILECEQGKLAISTTELTCQSLSDYCQQTGSDRKLEASELPFEISNLKDIKLVLDYCNWSSKANQLAPDQCCYPLSIELAKVPTLSPKIAATGFRLPSIEEYREFNSSSGAVLKLKMDTRAVVLDYAWAFENTGAVVQPAGSRLPNSLGLFDALGNVQELSQSQFSLDTEWHSFGQTVRAEAGAFSNQHAALQQVRADNWTRVGFRIVRRLN